MTRRGTRKPVGNGASAPGGLSSFQITHRTGNTKRPNANDMPKLTGGTFAGTRGQPTSPGGATKAIYDHDHRDMVRYIPQAEPPTGEPPEGKLGVFNSQGVRVGVVGAKAGAPVAARMLGHNNVALTKLHGKPAWVSKQDPVALAARRVSSLPLAKSLRADKGSNK